TIGPGAEEPRPSQVHGASLTHAHAASFGGSRYAASRSDCVSTERSRTGVPSRKKGLSRQEPVSRAWRMVLPSTTIAPIDESFDSLTVPSADLAFTTTAA